LCFKAHLAARFADVKKSHVDLPISFFFRYPSVAWDCQFTTGERK
jgi:hypothetical protein